MADTDGLSPEAQAALSDPMVDQAFSEVEELVDELIIEYATIRAAYQAGAITGGEAEVLTGSLSDGVDALDKDTIATLLLEAVTRLGNLGPALALSAHSELGNEARACAAQKES